MIYILSNGVLLRKNHTADLNKYLVDKKCTLI